MLVIFRFNWRPKPVLNTLLWNPNSKLYERDLIYLSHNTHRKHDISVKSQKKQQNMVIKVSGLWVTICGTHCQKKLNLQPQYLYSKIWSNFGFNLNGNVNCALSNPLHTETRTILSGRGMSDLIRYKNGFSHFCSCFVNLCIYLQGFLFIVSITLSPPEVFI